MKQLILLFFLLCTPAHPREAIERAANSDFAVNYSINDQKGVLLFVDGFVLVAGGVEDRLFECVFDLEKECWYDFDAGKPLQMTTLVECQKWVEKSLEKSKATLAEKNNPKVADPIARRFTEMLVEPRFEVIRDGNRVKMTNEFFAYDVEMLPKEKLSVGQKQRLCTYGQLNVYRSALRPPKLLSLVSIELNNEIKRADSYPARISFNVKVIAEVSVNTTFEYRDITGDEKALGKRFIQEIRGASIDESTRK